MSIILYLCVANSLMSVELANFLRVWHKIPTFDAMSCGFYCFFSFISVFSSLYANFAIAIERALTIFRPTVDRRKSMVLIVTYSWATVLVMSCGTFYLVMSAEMLRAGASVVDVPEEPYLYNNSTEYFSLYASTTSICDCVPSWEVIYGSNKLGSVVICLMVLIPILGLIILYLAIGLKVYCSRVTPSLTTDEASSQQQQRNQRQKKYRNRVSTGSLAFVVQ